MNANSTSTEYSFLDLCKFYVEGVAVTVVGSTGVIINLTALIFLLQTRRRHVFQNLLLSLTIYDLALILLMLASFAFPQFSGNYRSHVLIHALPFLIPLAQTVLACSSCTTVALSVERYVSICTPYRRGPKASRSANYILPVLAFSILYNLPRYFEWVTVQSTSSPGGPCEQALSSNATERLATSVDDPLQQTFIG